jgi:hypothetical protein
VWAKELTQFGLTPPNALQVLAFPATGSAPIHGQHLQPAMVGFAMIGVALYGLATMGLWRALTRSFGPATGRAGASEKPRLQPAAKQEYAVRAVAYPVSSGPE